MERNKTLDVYKGMLIILVLLRHVLQYSVLDEGGLLTNLIWAVQMPGFMLVSGYFSCKKIPDVKSGLVRVKKAAEHYALPFLTWFFLISVLLLGNFERNFLLGAQSLFTNVDGGLWFLWTVFMLSIVATGCNIAMSRGKSIYLGFLGVIAVCIIYFGILLGLGIAFGVKFIGIKYILYYSVFYGAGWLVRVADPVWKKWLSAKNTVLFVCLVIFLGIVYNYDLYHCGDDIRSIAFRCVSGFTGNIVILSVCECFKDVFRKVKLDKLGMYTLEIYATHMYVCDLFQADNQNSFFTTAGFCNFFVSLICTVIFTAIIILVFKSIPLANWLMYGKKRSN